MSDFIACFAENFVQTMKAYSHSTLASCVILVFQMFFLAVLLAVEVFSACNGLEPPISIPRGDNFLRDSGTGAVSDVPVSTKPLFPQDSLELNQSTVYVCGVQRPDKSSPAGMLVLFRDGVKICEMPLTGSLASGVDADTHFLVEGDLYLCLVAASETYIFKNGVKLFSYPMREYITGLLVREDGVWTMGRRLDTDGFTIRQDGKEIFGKLEGTASELYEDEGHIYASYKLEVGGESHLYLVKDDSAVEIVPSNGGNMLSARMSRGELWTLCNFGGYWELSSPSFSRKIYRSSPGKISYAELIGTDEGCAALVGLYFDKVNSMTDVSIYGNSNHLVHTYDGLYHYYMCGGDLNIVSGHPENGISVKPYGMAGDVEVIDSVRFGGQRCAMPHDGQLYVCCNPRDSTLRPFVWRRGGQRETIPIDGYLTGIYVCDAQ